jgi:hypothetical protein
MKDIFQSAALVTLLAWGNAAPALAQENLPGAQLEGLLAIAKANNPDYASMRQEAQAASERVVMAGALMDPKFRVEWMDITKGGSQSATLLPNDTGSTIYTFMQDLPWWGKRDLKRAIAAQEAQAVDGKAQGTWAELAAKVKTTHAQRYFLHNTRQLTQELLDLTNHLAQVTQVRYAGGLAMQQDAIRAQVEQTTIQTELVALESEAHQADARLNALLARPSGAPLAAPESLPMLPAAATLDADSLLERVRQRNPQIFSEDARIKAPAIGTKDRATAQDQLVATGRIDFSGGLGRVRKRQTRLCHSVGRTAANSPVPMYYRNPMGRYRVARHLNCCSSVHRPRKTRWAWTTSPCLRRRHRRQRRRQSGQHQHREGAEAWRAYRSRPACATWIGPFVPGRPRGAR